VNQQDQQAIDQLFQHLYQATAQAGPRDSAAEALIQRYIKQAPPGLLYQMAQTLVAQQHTLNQLRAQQQQNGASAGFGPPPGAGYQQGYRQPQYQQPQYQQPNYQYQQPGRQGGGFLAGAGQLALGIGGGILGAEVLTDIFSGGDLFGGDRGREEYDEGFRDGFASGDDNGDRDDYQGQDPGDFDDNGGFDDFGGDDGIF
jgi:hypothetical protein